MEILVVMQQKKQRKVYTNSKLRMKYLFLFIICGFTSSAQEVNDHFLSLNLKMRLIVDTESFISSSNAMYDFLGREINYQVIDNNSIENVIFLKINQQFLYCDTLNTGTVLCNSFPSCMEFKGCVAYYAFNTLTKKFYLMDNSGFLKFYNEHYLIQGWKDRQSLERKDVDMYSKKLNFSNFDFRPLLEYIISCNR